ncbi:hypothetical protein [Marinomonas sp. IMCC 4694]|uniref:hypothetical protein n=1 Tax=Marinomonas sp. IMCC 4694 TaxID=2605432 RepID=UPI0021CC7871|nr:hypothetical protein [Marinomonas sp. IMCC 4694]
MKRFFLLACLLLASFNVSSAIYVVHDDEESAVRSLTFQLSKLLPTDVPIIPIRRLLLMQNVSQLEKNDLVVTVGADSFRQLCSIPLKSAMVAVFIGQEEYLNIQPRCSVPSSAVFSGAPLEKRLTLLNAIWFDRKPLSVIYSDSLFIDEVRMQRQAAQYGFEFQFLKTATDRLSVLRSINFVLEDSTIIFSLVDTELYKNGNAQDILRLLFHKRQIIIGPSLAFVQAGSLFAVYSDTSTKLSALAGHIMLWNKEKRLPAPSYPDLLRVSFNPYLIKFHGVVLPSPAFLKEKYGLCSEKMC